MFFCTAVPVSVSSKLESACSCVGVNYRGNTGRAAYRTAAHTTAREPVRSTHLHICRLRQESVTHDCQTKIVTKSQPAAYDTPTVEQQ